MIKVVYEFKDSNAKLPARATDKSAGYDVRACIGETIFLKPGERVLISTGISVALPDGYEAQVRPRSGLALKYGITVLNSPGTIDADYRGIIGIILINHGYETFPIVPLERIGQLVFNKVEEVEWEEGVTDITDRGTGGFGHTGKD